MFYIFYGDDEFRRTELMRSLKSRMGDPAMADLNTATLNGQTTTLTEITNACNTLPFAADRRLVIIEGLLTRLQTKKAGARKKSPASAASFGQQLLAYLKAGLPPTTRLVFLEPGNITGSPILKLAKSRHPNNVKSFTRLTGNELTRWIKSRVKQKHGDIEGMAAAELAAIGGTSLRKLDQEIEKLVLYAGSSRPIAVEDVRQLVSDVREANIFELMDAIGRRREGPALRLLHQLLDEGHPPPRLLMMITRQIRILLQIKVLAKESASQQDIASRLRLHPYVVKKAIGQAKSYTVDQLRIGFANLLETDLAIKTGRVDPFVALDLLVVSLSQADDVQMLSDFAPGHRPTLPRSR